ncbi:hypothetical protein MHIB_05110 [Mycolicibacter hiberniae]|uniref:Uncharacterized protein n=1 Tax=Mycolicibacter hiberniae TaxID=29314 RepID=A0A7I7WZW3_9MYCO|nr:hypothetical protein MHIB_05110 [Mycolicibacter hiberniae]
MVATLATPKGAAAARTCWQRGNAEVNSVKFKTTTTATAMSSRRLAFISSAPG